MKRTLFCLLIMAAVLFACSREKTQTPQPGSAIADRGHAQIARAEIAAVNPTSSTALVMQYTSRVADDGGAVQYRFRWYVDGSLVPEATGNLLDPAFFSKGSQVEGEIIPVINDTEAKGYRTQPVTILNTAPTVVSIELPKVPVFAGDSVTVQVQGSDIDRNDAVSYLYQWEVNGKPVPGAEGNSFDTAGLKKKSTVSVTVTPFDGEAKGLPLRSATSIMISNSNPDITSNPPSGLSGGIFTYQVAARDQDGDAITYRLVTAPPGMTIDSSGMMRWEAPRQVAKPMDVAVKVAADDGDGGISYQEFSLFLETK